MYHFRNSFICFSSTLNFMNGKHKTRRHCAIIFNLYKAHRYETNVIEFVYGNIYECRVIRCIRIHAHLLKEKYNFSKVESQNNLFAEMEGFATLHVATHPYSLWLAQAGIEPSGNDLRQKSHKPLSLYVDVGLPPVVGEDVVRFSLALASLTGCRWGQ